ncbi:bifunctional phosphopantothenoylcysteine decarboxylase/phosphopantothenate--cysteine ligase CoaBC [Candidatus Methylospira mobilis]|uniref:Coenzyme A biosynthesis bifunctional protein CoaBC n=1 Tax=Candidatus Methylospira mobilis TaxID=1808979 RepID=A0A5Q0BN18_9GAMM|nr:bifunctional phosphopantothenoylcysteine decarboxylase/phosphopantothenate--cysteine ligase CoaBC [Candidatus Methylospira mobilis]
MGVTGGIAAYKTAELTRLLRVEGAEVRVAMTEAAMQFVGALTFQALSGNPVHTQLLDAQTEAGMGHISLARWADLILIAPASADFIARLRAGFASDLLSALCLARTCPLAIAPAMNQAMWKHPATQENVARLTDWGVQILGPAQGSLACGEEGPGRMLEPSVLLQHLAGLSGSGVLTGLSVLISAGPTREPLDPVRYLSNRSSGKMGLAIALAALRAGAKVGLVHGPIALKPPRCHEQIQVESAQEMHRAVLERAAAYDIYIGAAAVADYTPMQYSSQKIKKTDDKLSIPLSKTADILAAVAQIAPPPFTVGFAAESEDLENYARGKLQNKKLDMIAANAIGNDNTGFNSDTNALSVFWQDGSIVLPLASKTRIAEQLINLIAQRFHAKNSTQTS